MTLHEALALYREMDDKWGINLCLVNLGLMAAAAGHYVRATAMLRELMHLSLEVDDKLTNMYSFFGLACVADSEGHTARAARLWGISEAILRPLASSSAFDVLRHEVTSRLAKGHAPLWVRWPSTPVWAQGKAMTPEEAVEYALSEEKSAPPRPLGRSSHRPANR